MLKKMRISEIFKSFQGEGMTAGMPAVFIRFYGCNLNCKWCDSKYATKQNEFKEMNLYEIKQQIIKYKCNRIVFTGGEPLLQKEELTKLIKYLYIYYTYEIETNGTIMLPMELWYNNIQLNISPKLSNSGNKRHELARVPHSLQRQFKFVVQEKKDFKVIEKFIDENYIPKQQVYIMPEGITRESQLNSQWIIDECLKHGYNFCPRLHIIYYNNQRKK